MDGNLTDSILEIRDETQQKESRVLSIDVFRGFTIASMIFVNTANSFGTTPIWINHAVPKGLTPTDLVAPFFIFAIAITYGNTWNKLKNIKALDQYTAFGKRYLALFAMGTLGSIRLEEGIPTLGWETFSYIGVAGMVTLFFIASSWKIRLAVAIVLLVVYQILLDFVFMDVILAQTEGGLFGAMSWSAMMLLSTVVAHSLEVKKFINFLWSGSIILTAGIISLFVLEANGLSGCSRPLVSSSYGLISIGAACIVYYIIYLIFDVKKSDPSRKDFKNSVQNLFSVLGKNPFFIFIIHGLLIEIVIKLLDYNTPFVLVALIAVSHVVLMDCIAYKMDRKKIYIRI